MNGHNFFVTLNKTSSFTDMGTNSDLVLCFSHLGLIKDHEDDEDLEDFPPEPFFTHLIAEAMAKQVYNPDSLKYVPPSHYHNHDYVLLMNNQICVIVGEGMSGKDYKSEMDKCLPGICKMLQVLSKVVSMTSAQNICTVSLGHVSAVEMHADKGITALVIDSIDILNRHTEEGYAKFIITILDMLELFLHPIVDSDDIFCNTPPNPFMNPTRGCDGFSRLTEINIPGVYRGRNAAFVKDLFPEMYQMYEEGHLNRERNRAFPQFINNLTGNHIRLHMNLMVCKHNNPNVKIDIADRQIVSPAQLESENTFHL